jgi:hypothetical protein
VITAVLRAIRSQWRQIARLLSRVECCPSDLLICSRHAGETGPQLPSVIGNRRCPALSTALSGVSDRLALLPNSSTCEGL